MFMCRAICQDSVCSTPSPISRYSSGVISCRSCTVSVTLRVPPPRTTATSTGLPTLSSSSASTASKSDIALPSIATSTSPTASWPSAPAPGWTSVTTSMPVRDGEAARASCSAAGGSPRRRSSS